MSERGIWLDEQDARQISHDLLVIWYALRVPGRTVTTEMEDCLKAYQEFFQPCEDETPWPATKLV